MKKRLIISLCLAVICSLVLSSCSLLSGFLDSTVPADPPTPSFTLDTIPEFDGKTPYVVINDNVPYFDKEDVSRAYESFSELDSLNRCGTALACIGIDLMPTEPRGSIGQVKPSGWHTVKYDVVDGKYLYNRCHLIGFQLTGENANEQNLITGTRYMNVVGMLPFENMVADYIKAEPKNHVLYRVSPIYEGNNLVATGVLMEAMSVEDNGEDIMFCVFVYNAQPQIGIDYKDGDSWLLTNPPASDTPPPIEECATHYDTTGDGLCEACGENATAVELHTYVLNTNTQKFHKETCTHAGKISDKNKATYIGTREDLVLEGYDPCGTCKP